MSGDVTQLLGRLRGEGTAREDATERLAELLYPELRQIAARLMRGERRSHTLQPTAIVHEAFLRLVGDQAIGWQDRAHFLGIAARVMRRVLVDHARRRGATKRGSGGDRVTLDEDAFSSPDPAFDLLALDDLLTRLAAIDQRAAHIAELRIFGGLTVRETAEELAISVRTVSTDWTMARLWLSKEFTS